MLYWAAFLGRDEVVEKIIKMGYSPFMHADELKNAVFGAVEGNRPETLRLIFSFNYIPTDERKFS